jgi:hypothetical protein
MARFCERVIDVARLIALGLNGRVVKLSVLAGKTIVQPVMGRVLTADDDRVRRYTNRRLVGPA